MRLGGLIPKEIDSHFPSLRGRRPWPRDKLEALSLSKRRLCVSPSLLTQLKRHPEGNLNHHAAFPNAAICYQIAMEEHQKSEAHEFSCVRVFLPELFII